MTLIEKFIQKKETFSIIVCQSFGEDTFMVTSPKVAKRYYLEQERTYKGACVVDLTTKDVVYFYRNLQWFKTVQKTDFSIVYEVKYSSLFVKNLLSRVFYIDKVIAFFDLAEKDLNKHNKYIDNNRNDKLKEKIIRRILKIRSGKLSNEDTEELKSLVNELESHNEGIFNSVKTRFSDLRRKTRKIANLIETNIYHS